MVAICTSPLMIGYHVRLLLSNHKYWSREKVFFIHGLFAVYLLTQKTRKREMVPLILTSILRSLHFYS